MLGADHQPRAAAALRQRARQRRAACTRHRDRTAHPRFDRPAARASGLQRLVRPVGAAARTSGSTPMSPTSSPGHASAAFRCPMSAFRLALDRLRNFVANAESAAKDGGRNLAYALYVLARNGAAPVGDLRYFADAKLDAIATPIAKAQIAAALGMLGDRTRAERVYAAALASIAPQPALEYGRDRLRLGAARRRRTGDACLGGRRRAPDHHRRGRARRGGAQPDALHLDPGECVDGAGGARARQGGADAYGSTSAASAPRARSTAACAPATCEQPLQGDQTGEDATVQAVVTVTARRWCRSPPPSAASRSSASTTRSPARRSIRPRSRQNDRFAVVLRITEPQAAVRPGHRRRLSAGRLRDRQSAAGVVRRHRHARLDRGCAGAGERGVPRRSLQRGVRAQERGPSVFTVAYVVRAVSPGRYVHPQAYVEDMYRPDRFGRTAHRHGRGDARRNEMSGTAHHLSRWSGLWRRLRRGLAVAAVALIATVVRAERIGTPPLGPVAARLTGSNSRRMVVDRDGRLLRPYTTSEGRWRLPAARADVDPRFLEMLIAYEDRRFHSHHGVDPLALRARLRQLVDATAGSSPAPRPSPCRWRGCSSRARERTRRRSFARWCARSQLERALDKDEILALYLSARALWRQSRRRARGLARLFRQGAAAADAGGSGAAGGAAAVARSAPARPLGRRGARVRATACSTALAAAGVVPADEIARAKPRAGAGRAAADADAGAACRRRRRSPRRPAARHPSPDHRCARCRSSLEDLARERARALGPDVSVAILAVDHATGEVLARVASAGLFRRAPRRPGRHDAGAALARLGAEAVHLRPRLRGRARPSRDADRGPADPLRRLRAGEFRPRPSRAR